LEGLEISEVWLNDVLNGVETFRLDAEYHAKEYERIENFVKNNPERFSKFSNWNVGIDCSAFYPGVEPLYGTGDIPLIRVQNVKEEIEYDNCVTLPILSSDYDTLKFVSPGDIVITKGGSIGFVGYVTKRAYASRDLMFINSSQLEERERVFLYLYLSTDFSFKQLIRSSSQCAQPHLTITLVKNFDIFLPNESLKDKCLSLYQEYSDKHIKSKQLYSEAEELLLKELGLKKWQPNNTPVNIKQLKESFLASGRLDAEHYMVKYDELESLIMSVPHKRIAEIQLFNARGVQPDYVQYGEVSVVNSKHILEDGLDYDNFEHTTTDFLKSHNRARIEYGDILIYTTGANIGRTQVYLKDEPAVASNHVNILRVHDVNPIYLALVLNSQVGRLQTEKLCTGSAQAELYPDDIEKFIVPILPEKTQQTIAAYVQKSISLRNEAKQLLESAKLKVEDAISTPPHLIDNQSVIEYYKMIVESTYYYRLAEWILLQELYDEAWVTTSTANYSIKNYSVCKSSGRLDAEYYQPKYDALFAQLSKYECNTIEDIAHIKKSVEPGSEAYQDSGIPFVRVSDVSKFGISEPNIYLSPSDFNLNELRPKKDTILLSKDGSVGIAYKVEEDMDCITSGALLHLSIFNEDYTSDYLTLVLNSIVVQMQAERDSNGAIIQHWKPSEIEQVIIPKLPKPIQETISAKIQESFALKAESKRLLDEAKMMVEREIEKGGK
jgi:type I restriction enzyme S subunit